LPGQSPKACNLKARLARKIDSRSTARPVLHGRLDILRGAVLLILAIGLPAKWLKSGGTMVVPNWGHLPWWPYWRSINPQPAMVSRRPGSGYPQVPSKVDSAK
jgi:hypothetical protein